MAEFVVRAGGCTAQGRRPNNEDRFVADAGRHVYLVADGMGGQEAGEVASGLAADRVPRAVADRLAAGEEPSAVAANAIRDAHEAILDASKKMASARRMGTTAVLALVQAGQAFVAGVGDSPAFLARAGGIEQLTSDHTIAAALARNGTITAEQAKTSPYVNVLYRFLGCAEMTEAADVRIVEPQAGDRLLLASDGLSNVLSHADLVAVVAAQPHAQQCADALVSLSLERGSKDNVTCVVVAFDAE